ncbi:MAG TPA: bifunctional diguanylate cyclase/phosphodiesterase [Sphaerochaeta sp.]|nr:bifunctional diguanylate cyclase/phosphodiesterase [Sphaerochaeta sp.]
MRNFYYQQRIDEALLTAKSYAITFGLLIDNDHHFDHLLFSPLDLCEEKAESWEGHVSTEQLAELAEKMGMDVIYLYDTSLTIIGSSDGDFIGWQVPAEHPIRQFHESGEKSLIESIRISTDTTIPYKFALYRCSCGKIIQCGIEAQNYVSRYGHLQPQRIIEELAQYSRDTRIAILDTQQLVIASSRPGNVGFFLDPTRYDLPIDETQYRIFRMEGTSYLGVHLPLDIRGTSIGSLVVLSSLQRMNWLIHRVSLTISLILLAFYVSFFLAFSRAQRLNQRILHFANHDPLTNLPNLRYYNAEAPRLLHKPHALMVTNLVNFKRLNMLYGYAHGDEVLIAFASFIKAFAAEHEGAQAYRLSSDRFILSFTKHTNHWNLNLLATTLIERSIAEGICAHQGLAIGIAQHTGGKRRKHGTLLKEALIALDASDPLNPIQFYNADLEAKLVRSNHIEDLLNRVISGEEGLLLMYFQPVVDCKAGVINTFEALARLECPDLGIISPAEFIPVAEREHLIIPLGKIILSQAVELITRQNSLGIFSCRVAVNLSAQQLIDDSFPSYIEEQLLQGHLHPSRLIFELTESSFVEDPGILLQRIAEIRAMGIRFAIDDFGDGYSSLSRLKDLPFDALKIGRRFTEQIATEEDMYFIRTVIALAHQLGKLVVAEGVETKEQQELLTAAGCDYLQGYLFDRPLPLRDAMERCKRSPIPTE